MLTHLRNDKKFNNYSFYPNIWNRTFYPVELLDSSELPNSAELSEVSGLLGFSELLDSSELLESVGSLELPELLG